MGASWMPLIPACKQCMSHEVPPVSVLHGDSHAVAPSAACYFMCKQIMLCSCYMAPALAARREESGCGTAGFRLDTPKAK